jgi:hypothetical protein
MLKRIKIRGSIMEKSRFFGVGSGVVITVVVVVVLVVVVVVVVVSILPKHAKSTLG